MATANFLITHASSLSVKEIMNRVEKILNEKKVTIFARISHSQAARDAGLTMPDEELLIFGNPAVGTALMLDNPAIGIELPLKIIAWREGEKTLVAYHNLDKLAEIFSINAAKNTLTTLTNFMANLVAAVVTS
jgi:uncharacterized protein (DUF302 family)